MRVRAGSAALRVQYRPLSARLSDSVPPEVKMTSEGWAPAAAASCFAGLLHDAVGAAAGAVQRGGVAGLRQLMGHGRQCGAGHGRRGCVV